MYDQSMTSSRVLLADDLAVPPGAGSCPVTVRRASMTHRWDDLTFVHWSFDPADVQRLLPEGLTVQTFEGRAWVGLVPFAMQVGFRGLGVVPWVADFLETNVRTYVTAADGSAGIWFFSLDAQRLGPVIAARTTYRLPYFWSSMRYARFGDIVTYDCRRRAPGPRATSSVAIEIGDAFAATELGDLDHWLTARWRLYRGSGTRIEASVAEHEPWPLHRARLLHCDDHLITAAGLPQPDGSPIVHWSPGVGVRIGFPRRVRAAVIGGAPGCPTTSDATANEPRVRLG